MTSATAIAHESRPAYLELTERTAGHYEVTWRRPALGEQVLALAPRFPVNCHDATPHTIQKTAGAVLERWQLVCDASGLVGHTITIEGLSRTITDVLVRVTLRAGSSETHIAHAHAPSVVIHGAPTSLAVAGSYLRLGIEHIWSGIDHLLFVLGLLLLVQRRWALLKTITAFTIAHSITLGLATLGVVHIPQAPVEAVIALSILFLAVELARERLQPPESRLVHQECHPECNEGSLREILRSAQNDTTEWSDDKVYDCGEARFSLTTQYPWVVAFTFGLLHGFGFAGALAEVGLPATDIPLALLMFNLGVEAGQIAFIVAVLATAATVRHWSVMQRPAWRWPTVYAIGSLSAFWLIQRIVAFF